MKKKGLRKAVSKTWLSLISCSTVLMEQNSSKSTEYSHRTHFKLNRLQWLDTSSSAIIYPQNQDDSLPHNHSVMYQTQETQSRCLCHPWIHSLPQLPSWTLLGTRRKIPETKQSTCYSTVYDSVNPHWSPTKQAHITIYVIIIYQITTMIHHSNFSAELKCCCQPVFMR